MPKKTKATEKIIITDAEPRDRLVDFITGDFIPNKPENREAKVPFEKRLVEEYGYRKDDIEPEFRIQKGSALIGPADIVVFDEGKPHTLDSISIVIECKKKNRKDGLQQLKTYLAGCENAQYGVWFNGEEILYLKRIKTAPHWKEMFNIPKRGETLGLPRKADLREATELTKLFGIIHNYVYANDGLSSSEAFSEVLKLLFIKIEDEKDVTETMANFGVSEEEYDAIREGKATRFPERINELFDRVKRNYHDVFNENDRINLKTTTLSYVVGQLQNLDLRHSKRDVKGAAFQKFVYAHQRGERGQFFTPDPIINLIVKFLDPKPSDRILDPATGTGGFLVESMKHVWEKHFTKISDPRDRREHELDFAKKNIRGIEINPTLSKVAKMRMILEDDGYTGIFSENSLEDWQILHRSAKESDVQGEVGKGAFDIIMTNPPFGTAGRIDDRSFLERFDLGWKWKEEDGKWSKDSKLMNAQVPDILFIERCLDFLKDGGRMGIVLPDGDLTNSSLAYVRNYIRNRARILAVVSLPKETFIPHGAGVKASVLFLQKLPKEELEKLKKKDYPIFFGIIEKIGYEGDKNGTPMWKRNENGEIISDADGQPIKDEDVSEVVEAWREFKRKNL
jgi:type I restriction enzyme M protein